MAVPSEHGGLSRALRGNLASVRGAIMGANKQRIWRVRFVVTGTVARTNSALRQSGAMLLSIAAGYLLVTDWILDPWSDCVAFAVVFAFAAAVAVRALAKDFPLLAPWSIAPLAVAVLWGLGQLAAGVPEYRFATWWATLGWAAALALFWAGMQLFSDARLSSALRSGIVVFGALIGLEAVLQLFSGTPRIYGIFALNDDTPAMGPFRNRDHFCALMELMLPVALWSGIANRRRSWIYFTCAGAMYASAIASASRAGAIIATLEIVVLFAIALVRRRAAIAVAVLAAIGGGVAGWRPVLDRFHVKDLFLYRREFLASTIEMIHDHPWRGFGLGSWPFVYPRYAVIDVLAVANHAHNDWMEWAADGGIPFAVSIGLVAVRTLQLSLESPWGLGTVAVFVHAAVDFPLQRPPLLFAVLFVLALMEAERARALRDTPLAGRVTQYGV